MIFAANRRADQHRLQGLFGMNVNIFSSNPPWWWYLIIAGITMSITFTIWIIFKRSRNVGRPFVLVLSEHTDSHKLENNMENKFSWLVGRADPEKALAAVKNGKYL
jgi:hypothetical protein